MHSAWHARRGKHCHSPLPNVISPGRRHGFECYLTVMCALAELRGIGRLLEHTDSLASSSLILTLVLHAAIFLPLLSPCRFWSACEAGHQPPPSHANPWWPFPAGRSPTHQPAPQPLPAWLSPLCPAAHSTHGDPRVFNGDPNQGFYDGS